MRAAAVALASLAVLSLLAGCLGGDEQDPTGKLGQAPLPPESPLVAYLHNLSVPDPSITVQGSFVEHHRVLVGEDVELDTWIVRPDVPDPVPLVLTVTPYYAGGTPVPATGGHALGRLGDELVPRGYAVGVSSVRGTGLSSGCFTQGGAQEARDTTTVVEAMAGQPWSNGKVGLIGVSYDGTTPQDAWVLGSPSLKTVVPISGISDLYKYTFNHGIPIGHTSGFNTYYWALVGAAPFPLGGVPADPIHIPGAVVGEVCEDQLDVQAQGVATDLDGTKTPYWQERDFLAELMVDPTAPRASMLYVHGLQDWNVKDHNMEGWLEAVQSTGVPFKALLGQWGHAWPQAGSLDVACEGNLTQGGDSCRNDWWNRTLVAWFDQFLKDVDTGILDTPAVQVQDDAGVWRHEARWPPTDVEWRTLRLGAAGRLGDRNVDGSVSYQDARGTAVDVALPVDGPTQVVFRSDPVPRDLRVSGLPRFTGNVTASGDRAALILTLAEQEADGTLRTFNFGGQSLNHVDGLTSMRADISGLRQRVTVDFFPADDVVHKGSRILLFAASNTLGQDAGGEPGFQPIADGSTITLELRDAVLMLPVDTSLVTEFPQPYDDPDA